MKPPALKDIRFTTDIKLHRWKNGTLILEQETRRRAAGDRFEADFSGKAIDDFEG